MERKNNATFRQVLIRFCAPALAGLKCSNMMSCPNTDETMRELQEAAKELAGKNICIRVLYCDSRRMLVFVYRVSGLEKVLARNEIRDFLREFGYRSFQLEHVLENLEMRVAGGSGHFPHEIGAFLDYPLEDIRGFIENRGRNGLCCGEWKVYHEPEKAKKMFAKLEKCRTVYCQLFQDGRSLMQLTVPA